MRLVIYANCAREKELYVGDKEKSLILNVYQVYRFIGLSESWALQMVVSMYPGIIIDSIRVAWVDTHRHCQSYPLHHVYVSHYNRCHRFHHLGLSLNHIKIIWELYTFICNFEWSKVHVLRYIQYISDICNLAACVHSNITHVQIYILILQWTLFRV